MRSRGPGLHPGGHQLPAVGVHPVGGILIMPCSRFGSTWSMANLKSQVEAVLRSGDMEEELHALTQSPRMILNVLLAFLCSTDESLKWKSVEAVGSLVAKAAEEDMESARVMMRRFMWNLNDESGGIGWGIPEAMGEILARHDALADEYLHILVSYVREDGNPLDNPLLGRGALWGLGRVAQTKPERLKDSYGCFLPYLDCRDPFLRGLSAWILGSLGAKEAGSALISLTSDSSEIRIYLDHQLVTRRVGDLAKEALAAIDASTSPTPLGKRGGAA